MQIYCIILLSLSLIGLVNEDGDDRRVAIFIRALIYLPIYGRIFGWW
jgi:hypothetical protein